MLTGSNKLAWASVRRSCWIALLVATLVADVASAAAPSPAPGYLADDYHEVALGSNQFMSNAKLVGKSYPVQLSPKANPELYGPIWTYGCPAAAETVKFSRSVWLPGPPNGGGRFTYGSVLGSGEFSRLSTIDLIVNGDVIVHQRLPSGTGFYRVPVSGAALNAFHYGNNTITVRVVKLKTSGPCNTGNPATQLGVLFRLEGQFQTDLALTTPTQPEQTAIYWALPPATTVDPIINVTLYNVGPAWEANGTFQVIVNGAPRFALGTGVVTPPGPPLTGCQQTDNGLSHSVSCGLDAFTPFTSASLGTVFEASSPSSAYTDFSVTYSAYISAGAIADLNSADNQAFATITFCGTESTKPGCQTASPYPGH